MLVEIEELCKKYLKHFDYESSIFYAQILYDTEQSYRYAGLLAKTFILSGSFFRAYILLKKHLIDFPLKSDSVEGITNLMWSELEGPHKKVIYKFGFCCLKLKKYSEAINLYENVGVGEIPERLNSHENRLIGHLYQKLEIKNESVRHLKEANRKDPLCLAAFQSLCSLRVKPEFSESISKVALNTFISPPKTKYKKNPIKPRLKRETIVKSKQNKSCLLQVKTTSAFTNFISTLAKFLFCLRTNSFSEASKLFNEIPGDFYCLKIAVARLHSETNNYEDAEKLFKQLRESHPFNFDEVDTFSTVLWQLNRISSLSGLASQLLSISKTVPEFWAVAGNSFSLQGCQQKAISCFQNAVKADPLYAYGHNLLALEFSAAGDAEQAKAHFVNCIRADALSYKAWNGLGKIAATAADFPAAVKFYKKAVEINPENHVLLSQLAIAISKKGNKREALSLLEKIGSNKPMFLFQKAEIYYELGSFDKSLELLLGLTSAGEAEVPIMFLLGKVHKRKGQFPLAMDALSAAMAADDGKLGDAIESEIGSILRKGMGEFFSEE